MSGRERKSLFFHPRRLIVEWGYFATVFLILFLAVLPQAVGNPAPLERPHYSFK